MSKVHEIFVLEEYTDDSPIVYKTSISDDTIDSNAKLKDWINSTIINLYLEDTTTEYASICTRSDYRKGICDLSERVQDEFKRLFSGDDKQEYLLYGDDAIYHFMNKIPER